MQMLAALKIVLQQQRQKSDMDGIWIAAVHKHFVCAKETSEK